MRGRRRARGARAAAVGLVAFVVLAGCTGSGPSTPEATPRPLRILLVSDGSWDAPGVSSLRDALRSAGHIVGQVSPTTDGSSKGTASTRDGVLTVQPTRGADTVWSTSGTPTDATLLGLNGLFGSPDLMIAGIGDEYAASLTAVGRGTIGAALAAAQRNVPAVAVSTEPADPARRRASDYDRAADFTVRLLRALQDRPAGAPLLPARTVLNVNYPRGPQRARDVVLAPTSDASATTLTFLPGGRPGALLVAATQSPPSGFDDDLTALSRGEVTLSDLSADPDRATPPVRAAARVVDRLSP